MVTSVLLLVIVTVTSPLGSAASSTVYVPEPPSATVSDGRDSSTPGVLLTTAWFARLAASLPAASWIGLVPGAV